MDWYLAVLKKYAVFSGRAHRKEYWMFVLFNFIVSIGLAVIDGMLLGGPLLSFIYMLGILLPSLAVSVRRLHDTNRSAWWILIVLVPLIGGLIFLVFMIMKGDEESNQYGAVPADSVE